MTRRQWAMAMMLAAGLTTAGAAELEFSDARSFVIDQRRAIAPDIQVDPAGRVHVIFIDKDPAALVPLPPGEHSHDASDNMMYTRSDDGGQTFRTPLRVNPDDGDVWGFAVSRPQLAVSPDGTAHIHYTGNQNSEDGKRALVVRYARSLNDGQSFDGPRTLNSPAGNDLSHVIHGGYSAAHAFGGIAADDESVQLYWVDTRGMDVDAGAADVWATVSTDNGETFAEDYPVWKGDACPCCQLRATEEGGTVFVSARQVFEGKYRDSIVARTDDHGGAYTDRVRLGPGRWEIEACPLKPTAMDAVGDELYSAYYTMGEDPAGVYFVRSLDRGQTFSDARSVHPEAAVSDHPDVAASADGHVLLAWHGKTDGERRVFMRFSTDRGASFSPPMEVPAPEGRGEYPSLAAAPDGSFYLAWQQGEGVSVARVRVVEAEQAASR